LAPLSVITTGGIFSLIIACLLIDERVTTHNTQVSESGRK